MFEVRCDECKQERPRDCLGRGKLQDRGPVASVDPYWMRLVATSPCECGSTAVTLRRVEKHDPRPPPPKPALTIDLDMQCTGCGRGRYAAGKVILGTAKHAVIRANSPCECGDDRVSIRVLSE